LEYSIEGRGKEIGANKKTQSRGAQGVGDYAKE